MRKFGKRALFPVWNSNAGMGGGSSQGRSTADASFFERLAEWDCRRLSDVHNLYVCPVCYLWLRTEQPADADEPTLCPTVDDGSRGPGGGGGAHRGSGSGSGGGGSGGDTDGGGNDDDDVEDDEEEEEGEDRDHLATEPIATLFSAPLIAQWHERQAMAPEVGAAQCCFRKQSDLTAHLRKSHCLTDKAMRGTRERLAAYQMRGGDGVRAPVAVQRAAALLPRRCACVYAHCRAGTCTQTHCPRRAGSDRQRMPFSLAAPRPALDRAPPTPRDHG